MTPKTQAPVKVRYAQQEAAASGDNAERNGEQRAIMSALGASEVYDDGRGNMKDATDPEKWSADGAPPLVAANGLVSGHIDARKLKGQPKYMKLCTENTPGALHHPFYGWYLPEKLPENKIFGTTVKKTVEKQVKPKATTKASRRTEEMMAFAEDAMAKESAVAPAETHIVQFHFPLAGGKEISFSTRFLDVETENGLVFMTMPAEDPAPELPGENTEFEITAPKLQTSRIKVIGANLVSSLPRLGLRCITLVIGG